LYYGKGAGSEPTASAVIADLMDITRLLSAGSESRVPYLAFQPDAVRDIAVLPMGEITTSYYLRLRVADQAGVLADITKILAAHGISIDALLQKEADEGESQTDLVVLTHETKEKHMLGALQEIQNLKTVAGEVVKIRLENLS
jgi:homoserine dehydrogenase